MSFVKVILLGAIFAQTIFSHSLRARELISADEKATGPILKCDRSNDEIKVLHNIIGAIDSASKLDNARFDYFLFYGSLIGAYRHQSNIPWDDDADIIILLKMKEDISNMKDMLSRVNTSIVMEPWENKKKKSQKRFDIPHKIYYSGVYNLAVDVYPTLVSELKFLCKEARSSPGSSGFLLNFKLNDVYPMRHRPFGNLVVNVPRNGRSLLSSCYGMDFSKWCSHGVYNHARNVIRNSTERKILDCSRLYSRYPFVTTSDQGKSWPADFTLEVLQIEGKEIIQSVIFYQDTFVYKHVSKDVLLEEDVLISRNSSMKKKSQLYVVYVNKKKVRKISPNFENRLTPFMRLLGQH